MIWHEIKRLRRCAGMSQKELGARLGLGQSAVAMWECGKNSPGYDMLSRIA
ncbi:MAG: helix-turn-helix transcriptional regulator, partial [Oscillospiraceae bacterium]|nr:helix-turn-helix transcriptional regulator [Oscillospiraceae bacterium]